MLPRMFAVLFLKEERSCPEELRGTCAHHQRGLTVAIKRARHLALLPLQQRLIRRQYERTRETFFKSPLLLFRAHARRKENSMLIFDMQYPLLP